MCIRDRWEAKDVRSKYDWTTGQLADLTTPEMRVIAGPDGELKRRLVEKLELERRASMTNADLRKMVERGDPYADQILDLRSRTGALADEYPLSHARARDEVEDIYRIRDLETTRRDLPGTGRTIQDSRMTYRSSRYTDVARAGILTGRDSVERSPTRMEIDSEVRRLVGDRPAGEVDRYPESGRLDVSIPSRLDGDLPGRLDIGTSRLPIVGRQLGPSLTALGTRPGQVFRGDFAWSGVPVGTRSTGDLWTTDIPGETRPGLVPGELRPMGDIIPIETPRDILDIANLPSPLPDGVEVPDYIPTELEIIQATPIVTDPPTYVPFESEPPIDPPETIVLPETLPPALPPGPPDSPPPPRRTTPMELDSEWGEDYVGDALIKEVEGDSIVYYVAGSSVKWGPYDRNALVRSRRLNNHERNRLYQEYLGDYGIEDAGVWELAHVLKATGKSRSLTQAENAIRGLLGSNPTRMLRDRRVAV